MKNAVQPSMTEGIEVPKPCISMEAPAFTHIEPLYSGCSFVNSLDDEELGFTEPLAPQVVDLETM